MSDLGKKYKKIINNIENNIENQKDIDYVKGQLNELLNAFVKEIDRVQDIAEKKVEQVTARQEEIESKIQKMEQVLDNIEKDIYVEDSCDFQIVCPYCNYEFALEADYVKDEVECPECNNIIEIDWDGESLCEDDECFGGCSSCHGCSIQEEPEDKDEKEDDDM